MARAAGAAITVRFATRLSAVKPMPSPLPKLRMHRSLSAPVSENPGGRVIECGQASEVCSSSTRGSAADSADISSTSDATERLDGLTDISLVRWWAPLGLKRLVLLPSCTQCDVAF